MKTEVIGARLTPAERRLAEAAAALRREELQDDRYALSTYAREAILEATHRELGRLAQMPQGMA